MSRKEKIQIVVACVVFIIAIVVGGRVDHNFIVAGLIP